MSTLTVETVDRIEEAEEAYFEESERRETEVEAEIEAAEMDVLEYDDEVVERKTWEAGTSVVTEEIEEIAEEVAGVSVVMVRQSFDSIFETYGYDLSDDLAKAIMDFMNKIFATVMVGGRFKIIKQKFDSDLRPIEYELLGRNDFKALFENKPRINIGDKDMDIGSFWLQHSDRKEYQGITFDPSASCPASSFNPWHGFAVLPKLGNCDLYLTHIHKNICNGRDDVFDYVLGTMADLIQNPSTLPGVALVLVGRQGCGKGEFVRHWGYLLGNHFIHTLHGKHLVGAFNKHFENKLLCFVDEAEMGHRGSDGVLKGLITEPWRMIEGKGLNAVMMPNYTRFVFASNNDLPVHVALDNRRFLVLEVADNWTGNFEIFENMDAQMRAGGYSALMELLQRPDHLVDFDIRRIPNTDALENLKIRSMDPQWQWWLEKLQNGALLPEHDEWKCVIPVNDVYKDYLKIVGQIRGGNTRTDSSFGRELKKLVDVKRVHRTDLVLGGSRLWCYDLPSLADCRNQFTNLTGISFDWSELGARLR